MVMTRRATLGRAAALCAATSLSLPAYAHRQRLSVSEVEWNPTTKVLGVTHRFHLHDAEKALAAEGLISKPDLHNLRSQAKLALYVESQFGLKSGDNDIELSVLGAQVEGNNIYIFQEAILEQRPEALTVRCEILRSVFPDQRNHVNLRLYTPVKTLTFSGRERIKKA